MRSDKAAVLLNTLLKRTEEGRVEWTPTSTDDAYEVSFPNETLRVARQTARDSDGDYFEFHLIEIVNNEGAVIDKILPSLVSSFFRKPTAWEATAELFQRARDKALAVDEAVDDLLANLGGPVPLERNATDDLDDEIPF